MSLLFIDSFDHYVTANLTQKWTSKGSSPTIASGGRCDTQCLVCGNSASLRKGIVGGTSRGTAGFAFKNTINVFGTIFFQVSRSGAANNAQFYLSYDLDGSIGVFDGDNNEQARTTQDVVRQNVWAFIEVQWVISATVGSCTIRVNGVTVLAATNIDTRYSGHADNQWTTIELSGSLNSSNTFDDFYVLDNTGSSNTTFLGDVRVQALYPEGAGATTQWTASGVALNWDAVKDTSDNIVGEPDDDATYVHSTTVNQKDTYVYTDLAIGAGSVFGVQILIDCEKTDTGTRSIAPVVRHSGSDFTGSNLNPSELQYNYLISMYNTNPGTSVAWTIANVNAAQFGHILTV